MRNGATFDGPRFCPECGQALVHEPEHGRQIPSCPACGFVRYRNPVAGVAVIVEDRQGRVLLGQRASGPYAGLWCIPCGYVEWHEDIRNAAVREFEEETGLLIELGPVFTVHSNFHNPRLHTVGTWFRGTVVGGALEARDGELASLAYFDPADPPALAFPTDELVLAELASLRTNA